jgi:ABC-type multidrug transport system fused ATPase/permease subunit
MVLDGGKLVEFDSPAELLGRDGSLFRALVEESADKEQLYGLVQGKERL